MLDFMKAVFKMYPITIWISVIGVGIIFFGGRDWASLGFWMLGGVAVFMIVIYLIIEDIEVEKRKWNYRRKNGE